MTTKTHIFENVFICVDRIWDTDPLLPRPTIGSLSNNVFERRTSTGSGLFSFFDGGFAQIFSQIASIKVKKLRNTNFISSRHVKRENTSLPVDVRRSKTSLLKFPNVSSDLKIWGRRRRRKRRWKSESGAFFQSSSRLLQVTNFFKFGWTLLKLNC